MGSFKQISLGLICLVAAFAFGSYVNNRTPGDQHPVASNGDLLGGDSAAQIGNVQSRLALDGLETVNKRPARIATMRNPLPPPSQLSDNPALDTSRPSSGMPIHKQDDAAANPGPGVQVPDFSRIAAEFKNTPIELPPLGAMPSSSNLTSNDSQKSPPVKLKSLIAKQETATRIDHQSKTFQLNNEERWNIQAQPKLTRDDFSPKLKSRFPNSRSQEQNALADQSHEPATKKSPVADAKGVNLPNKVAAMSNHPNHNSVPQDLTGTRQAESRLIDRPLSNRVQAKLPFGLTDQSKSELVKLRSRANSKIALETTKFVDHFVQSGESLQSISSRYFGKPDFYLDIYLANRNKLRNPAQVPAGITVRVPMYQ